MATGTLPMNERIPITGFTVSANSTASLTVTANNAYQIAFMMAVTGAVHQGYGELVYVTGYATASRCSVIYLVQDSSHYFTVGATDTTGLIFTLKNNATNTDMRVDIFDMSNQCSFNLA